MNCFAARRKLQETSECKRIPMEERKKKEEIYICEEREMKRKKSSDKEAKK